MRAHKLLLTTLALLLLAPVATAQDTTVEPAAPDEETGAGGDGGDINVDITENDGAAEESVGDGDGWSLTTVLVVVVVAVLVLALVVAALSGRDRVDRS